MSKKDAIKYSNKATEEYYRWLESIIDQIKEGIFLAFIKNTDYLNVLKSCIDKKDNMIVVKDMGKIPNEIFKNLDHRTAGKLTKYGKIAFRGTYILEKAIQEVEKDERVKEFLEIAESTYPDRVKNYLLESRKDFWMGAYDSSIVMGGRALEFLLKYYFDEKDISYDEKWTLSRLINKLRSAIGSSKKTVTEELLEKVGEINRIYRNITAHDNPTQMGREDAELIWNNVVYVINKLVS